MVQKRNAEGQGSLNGYRDLIERMGDVFFSLDVEGNVTSAGKAVKKVLGFEPEEVVGENISAFIPEEALPQVKKDCARIRAGEALTPETTLYGSDGEVRNVRYSSVPIKRGNEIVGSQGIVRDITRLKQAEMELFEAIGRERKLFERVVPGLIAAVESRDLDTAGHQLRVSQVAVAVAEELGFSRDEIEGLRAAGRLHDIGHKILRPIGLPRPVANAALQHHERRDGSGYPGGLEGDQISPESEVIAVADIYEAMCSNRPYRPAPGQKAALETISGNKGKNGGPLFDPRIVRALMKVVRGGFKFKEVPRPQQISDLVPTS